MSFARLFPCWVIAASLTSYAVTLHPSVAGGDSGELVTAAYALGVAHPPGYPLHTLLGHVFTLLPFGSIAARVNFFSAVCSALASGALCWAILRWTRNVWAGVFAGLMFAFTPLVWRYAVTAEVFALNNLFASLLLVLAGEFLRTRNIRFLYWGAFIFGLGLSNHHTLLFVGAPVGLALMWIERKRLCRPRQLIVLTGLFISGLLPYLQLYVSAKTPTLVSWGDTSTLSGMLTHVLRREYGTFQLGLHSAKPDLPRALGLYTEHLFRDARPWTVLLALLGFVWGGWTARVLGLTWALYLGVFHSLSNLPFDMPLFLDVQTRFWQLPDLLFFAIAGIGLAETAQRLPQKPAQIRRVVRGLAIVLSSMQWVGSISTENQRDNRLFERFGRAILAPLPTGAVLITRGDLFLNTLRYLQICEGLRPDIRLLDRELLKAPWFARRVRQVHPEIQIPGEVLAPAQAAISQSYTFEALLKANPGRLIYVSTWGTDEDTSWQKNWMLQPEGFVYRVGPRSAPQTSPERMLRETAATFEAFEPSDFKNLRPGSWETGVADVYFAASARRAGTVLAYALANGPDMGWMQRARGLLEHLVASQRPVPPAVLKDLGVTYYYLRTQDPGLTPRMVNMWTRFLATSPPVDNEVKHIRRILSETSAPNTVP